MSDVHRANACVVCSSTLGALARPCVPRVLPSDGSQISSPRSRRHTRSRFRMPVESSDEDELLRTVLFLINENYWCALYELYVDARRTRVLEKSSAAANTLKSFFSDAKRFPREVISCVNDVFDSGVSAARVVDAESRAAVAEYELRCAREDARAGRANGTTNEDVAGDARATREAISRDDAFAAVSAGKVSEGVDVDAKLDAATYEYLSRRGYKATALSMRDESPTAAALTEKDGDGDKSWGEFGAMRRMYERARMTEQTASALERALAKVEEVENELIRTRARLDTLERESSSAKQAQSVMSANYERAESELSALRGSSAKWEKKAVEAESEVSRLLSELRVGNGEWSSEKNGSPRATIEEYETIDACVSCIANTAPKVASGARLELLPMISRACERSVGDEKRAARAARLFFDLYKSPNEEQRDAIARAVAVVGKRVGMEAFDAIFTRTCLDAEAVASMSGEGHGLVLEVMAQVGASSWFTSQALVMDTFRYAAVDPNDGVRAACARAMERYVGNKPPSADNMDTIDELVIALACDGSDDVADIARAELVPAVARWYLRSNPERFTDRFATKLLEKAHDELSSGWTGEGSDRSFVGWLSPEEGDRRRWQATSMMKAYEACASSMRDSLTASKPTSVEVDVDVALTKDIPDSWPLARWCMEDALNMITDVISSSAPDVVGQESVRESICNAVARWCGVLGPYATRDVLLPKLNEACTVSYDQRCAVLPILLAGVVPHTLNGEAVLGDYLTRLIRQVEASAADEIIDAARLLAAFERHTPSLLGALKECTYPVMENTPAVRLITARLLAATSEILHLEQVLADVYPTLNMLRTDPEPSVRSQTALALAEVACAHHETVEPTAQTMRQLEALVSDPDVSVRVSVIQALALAACVPRTSFSVSSAGAISAIARIRTSDKAIIVALFEASRQMLASDGDLLPQLAPALSALIRSDGLDQAFRAQAETMLRDGGWSAESQPMSTANSDAVAPLPSRDTPNSAATGSAFSRMKSRLGGRRAP